MSTQSFYAKRLRITHAATIRGNMIPSTVNRIFRDEPFEAINAGCAWSVPCAYTCVRPFYSEFNENSFTGKKSGCSWVIYPMNSLSNRCPPGARFDHYYDRKVEYEYKVGLNLF